ncbi:MAG: hypothetical protein RDU76_11430 [Candidatus Edwardsbacteria bacterium]|nr:hypothetical protein [Candidatus Edwardsbacteria bacterium]
MKTTLVYYIDDVRCGICGACHPVNFAWLPVGAVCIPCLTAKVKDYDSVLDPSPRHAPGGAAA